MVGTLKPYHMLNNLFESTALKGDGDGKKIGHKPSHSLLALAFAPTSHISNYSEKIVVTDIYIKI